MRENNIEGLTSKSEIIDKLVIRKTIIYPPQNVLKCESCEFKRSSIFDKDKTLIF